jgi:hypothetical protein
MPERTIEVMHARAIGRWRTSLVWAGPVLVAIGFLVERMWRSFPAPRAVETLVLAGVACGVAAIVRVLVRASFATSLALVFAVALICFAGLIPSAATLLMLAAAASIGGWTSGRRIDATAIVAGFALLAASIGWLLPFPLHYPFVYFLLSLVAVIAGRRRLVRAFGDYRNAWGVAVSESPRVAAFAVLAVGLASAGCWLPTVQFDDLSYHLGLPWQLSVLHYYRMDVQSQYWALAPWSGDILQAFPQVLTGGEARGAIDGVWLTMASVLGWQLASRLGATHFARWLAVALVASQPLIASLVGGMQAELPATAAALGFAVITTWVRFETNWRDVARFASIAGFLIALKTGFIAIVVPLLVLFFWRRRKHARLTEFGVGLLVFFFACGSSYFYAALVTGNPFFPLLTKFFPSPFPPTTMIDARWSASVDAAIVWRLTFDTAHYTEGWNGAAGFSLLGLLGALFIAVGYRSTGAMAGCAIVSFVAAIVTVHYFRYAFPAITLMIPIAVAAAATSVTARQLIYLGAALAVLNLGFQSCSYWTLHVGGIKQRVLDGSDAIIERAAPERALLQTVRESDPNANVLFCSPGATFGAELAGRAFVTSHYDVELENMRLNADADVSGERWRTLFAYTDATYVIASTKNAALTAALDDAKMIRDLNGTQLWALARKHGDDRLLIERDQARKKFWPGGSSGQ